MAKNKRKIVVERTTKFKNKDLRGEKIILLPKKNKVQYLILKNCECRNTKFIGTHSRQMLIIADKCDFENASFRGGRKENMLSVAADDCEFPSAVFSDALLSRDGLDGEKLPKNDFRKAVFHARSSFKGIFAGCVFSTGWGQRGMEKAIEKAVKSGNDVVTNGIPGLPLRMINEDHTHHSISVRRGKLEL